MHFLSEKMKSMLQSKQGDQFDTLRLTHVLDEVSGFRCRGKRLKTKRKISMACKKSTIDCFSLIQGQWKLFKSQWKVSWKWGSFFTFWWVAALLKRLCDGCLVLYFVNIVNDSVLYVVNVNVSEKLLDVNDKKKKQSTSIILVPKMYLPSRNLHQTLKMIKKKFGKL